MTWPFEAWVGKACSSVDRDGHSWSFTFEQAGGIGATCVWRITNDEGIILTRGDDGQKFGLPAPVDAAALALATLTAPISRVELDENTADLRIVFGEATALQFWNDSSGYEGWQASIVSPAGKTAVIGMGGGSTSGYDLPEAQ